MLKVAILSVMCYSINMVHDSKVVRDRYMATKREKYREAERRKQILANTVLRKVQAAESGCEIADVSFDIEGLGAFERLVLSRNPSEITDRMRARYARVHQLTYDDAVEPPRLTVYMWEADHENTPE
jgi:hypothetical protein